MTTPNQQPISPMQLMTTAVVYTMALNVFATSLGMIISASEGLEVAPALLKATDPAIEDLRKAYGDYVVSRALADVPEADAIRLAQRVEFYVHEELRRKYGDWAANQAIQSAPPGDLRTAIEIARTLQESGVGQESKVSDKAKAVARGKMRGRAKAEPQRDTKTNIIYKSKYAAGMAVAAEYGLDPTNTYVWYEIKKRDPTRFIPV